MKITKVLALLLTLAFMAVACGDSANEATDTEDEAADSGGETTGDDAESETGNDETGDDESETDDADDEAVEEESPTENEADNATFTTLDPSNEFSIADGRTDLLSGQTIAFSHPAAQAGVVARVVELAQVRADETGNELIVGAFENGTPDEQFSQVETWIAQGVDAIHVFPLDPVGLAPLQERAQAEGIAWVTYLLEMDGADGFLGVNPQSSGTALSEVAVAYVEENNVEGTGINFTFSFLPTLVDRSNIAADDLAAIGIEIVDTPDIIDTAGALTAMENALTANPDLRVAVAITDDAAVGAALALQNAGVEPGSCFVGGVDGSPEALQLLLDNNTCYQASAAVNIQIFSENLVETSLLAIAGEEASAVMTPIVLTPADTDLVKQFLSVFE